MSITRSPDWAVVDVETSGIDPNTCRVISVAALAVTADGTIEHTVVSLLDAGVDPGPTNIHGLTRPMLDGQPRFAAIAPALTALLRGRTLVAHNVAFDYAFLAAEARRAAIELPVNEVPNATGTTIWPHDTPILSNSRRQPRAVTAQFNTAALGDQLSCLALPGRDR